jgi:hypothetical protein
VQVPFIPVVAPAGQIVNGDVIKDAARRRRGRGRGRRAPAPQSRAGAAVRAVAGSVAGRGNGAGHAHGRSASAQAVGTAPWRRKPPATHVNGRGRQGAGCERRTCPSSQWCSDQRASPRPRTASSTRRPQHRHKTVTRTIKRDEQGRISADGRKPWSPSRLRGRCSPPTPPPRA